MEFNIKLSAKKLNIILAALLEQPARVSLETINEIQRQIDLIEMSAMSNNDKMKAVK
jgi:hypothetical protein